MSLPSYSQPGCWKTDEVVALSRGASAFDCASSVLGAANSRARRSDRRSARGKTTIGVVYPERLPSAKPSRTNLRPVSAMIWTNSARRRDSRSRPMRPGRGTARRVYERVSVHAEAKSTNPTLWHDLGAPITEPRRPLPDFGVDNSPPHPPHGRIQTPEERRVRK